MVVLAAVPPIVLEVDMARALEDIVPGDWDLETAEEVGDIEVGCHLSACRDGAGTAENSPGSRWAEDTRDE